MRKVLGLSLVSLLAVFSVNAQETTGEVEKQTKVEAGKIAKGMILGFRKAMSEKGKAEGTASDIFGSEEFSTDVKSFDHDYGFSVGYGDINIQNLGFITDITYNEFSDDGEDDLGAVRLTGSGTFGFDKNIYAFLGLNINDYVSGEGSEDFDMGIGYQFGITGVLNKNVSLSLSYYSTNNEFSQIDSDSSRLDGDFEMRITELGINYHF